MSLLSINENQINQGRVSFKNKLVKAQTKVIFETLSFAGIAFLITCGFAYLFYYLLEQEIISREVIDTLTIVSVCLLLVVVIVSLVMSFSKKLSAIWVGLMFAVCIFAFSISFSSLFYLFNGKELLMLFGLTGLTILICGTIGFLIPDKIGMTLMRFVFFIYVFYALFSLIFSLVSIFALNLDVWYTIYTILGGLIMIMINTVSFYQLSRNAQFVAMNDQITSKEIHMLCFAEGLRVYTNIAYTLTMCARMLLLMKR